jgi:hypothetical protein
VTSARAWLEQTCDLFPLLLDPEREVYRTYGLQESWLRSWNLRTLGLYVRLLLKGRKWRGILGKSTQLGGDFVVDADGVLQLVYPSREATDRRWPNCWLFYIDLTKKGRRVIDHVIRNPFDRLIREEKRWKSGACLTVMLGVALIVVSCSAAVPTETPVPPTLAVPTDTPATPIEPVPAETPDSPTAGRSYVLPTEDGAWTPPESHVGEMPIGEGIVGIEDIGEFTFDASQVKTLRPDIFQPGQFSFFDVLVHLAERGDIALDYHFDETMDTHVIDAINGQSEWWYRAVYSGGWSESNVFRMDMYPYKNNSRLWLHKEREERLKTIYRSFQDEVERLAGNGGQVIIPQVIIRSPTGNHVFRDVMVTAHDVRSDMFQPGVVTALDALLSLAEQGKLSHLKLTWYERIGTADPVDTYYVEQIDESEAYGTCGFVYETGPRGLSGTHIHIPSDIRVTVSPEYALWFWICL